MSKKQKFKNPVKTAQVAVSQLKSPVQKPQDAGSMPTTQHLPWLYVGVIVVATVLAFVPSLQAGFIWDDNAYIVESTLITPLDWAHFKQMWTTPFGGNYHPLTMISLAIERALVGTSPFLYHFNNLLIHIANSLLVFYLLRRLTANFWAAFVAGLLFGVHPLHVESVTWATERKDVLYVLFALLSFWFYLNATERNSRRDFWISVLLFVASSLSKGMAVVLPVLLVITDYYLLKRPANFKLILEKLPYWVVAVVFGIVAIIAQRQAGADASAYIKLNYNGTERLLFAFYNLAFYWIKMILPLNLSLVYPYPKPNELTTIYYIAPLVVLGIAGLAYWLGKRHKAVRWAVLFFVVCILPVMQLLPIGNTIVAERYFYLSSVGPLFLLGLLASAGIEKGLKTLTLGGVGLLTVLFGIQTFSYNKVWKDNLSIFSHATEQFPNSVMALRNIGAYYLKQKDYDKAEAFYAKAKSNSLVPNDLVYELGLTYYNKKDYPKAVEFLRKAADEAKTLPDTDVWMVGDAYYQMGQADKAMPYVQKALSIRPNEAQLYNFMGMIYMKQGQDALAVQQYEKALSLQQGYVDPFTNLSYMYIMRKDFKNAITVLGRALQQFPTNTSLLTNMGYAQLNSGDATQGIAYWKKITEIDPTNIGIRYNIGTGYEALGNQAEALRWFKDAAQKGSPDAINLLKSRGVAF